MKYKLLTLLLFVCGVNVAQDLHFSQFWAAPWAVNPGLTGVSSSDVRVITNYRNQWKSITDPFTSIGGMVDFTLLPKTSRNDFWGVGINYYNDKAGVGDYRGTGVGASLAYSKNLGGNNRTNMISTGFQFNFGQRNWNYASYTWDAQWDGRYFDSSRPTNEAGIENAANFSYVDLSAGIAWNYAINKNARIMVGGSLYHLNKPDLSVSRITPDKQRMRGNIHASAQIFGRNKGNVSFIPSVLYMQQGPQWLLNAGAAGRYRLRDQSRYTGYTSEIAMLLGVYYRVNDAAYVSLRFEVGDFGVGYSYDVNVSKLTAVSNGRGGSEIFLSYNKALYGNRRGNPKAAVKLIQQ